MDACRAGGVLYLNLDASGRTDSAAGVVVDSRRHYVGSFTTSAPSFFDINNLNHSIILSLN